MSRGLARVARALVLVPGLAGAALHAQEGPPPPLPFVEVEAPQVQERMLTHGTRLLVVPHAEVPFVTVNVVLPGGRAADPVGREGTATFVARLLDRGTTTRDFPAIAGTLDRWGISLSAQAAEEWTLISLDATTPALPVGLQVLAEVLVEAAFPQEQVELTRTQARTGLQVQTSRAAAVADHAFLRRVYGDHPYGRLASSASVSAIERDDLVAYHARWYRPDGALIVVAGDVEVDALAVQLDAALAGWIPSSRPPPPIEAPRGPDRDRPEIVVVHRPGAAQAEIRVGHLLMGGQVEGWEALVAANQLLGGGPSGRLQRVLRSALGYTYDARSTVTRLRRLGLFRIATATRPELVAATLEEVFRQVERLRTRMLPEAELDDKVSYLVGSYPRSVETPQQVAATLIEQRLLGRTDDRLDPDMPGLRALDTATVRAAAERFIRPEQFLVVVSGDAAVLQPQLRAFGEVTLMDVHGAPLTLAELDPPPTRVDLSQLAPATLHYEVVIGGARRGTATRILQPVEGGWRFASIIEAGGQRLEQELVVDGAMQMVSAATSVRAPTGDPSTVVERQGPRLVGERRLGGAATPIEMDVPDAVTLADGIELALWASPLEVGRVIRLPVVNLVDGTVRTVVATVEERVELTVAAGSFDTFRVVIDGDDPQIYHVLAEGPHIPIRMESASRPVALELTSPPALVRLR